MQIFADKRRD